MTGRPLSQATVVEKVRRRKKQSKVAELPVIDLDECVNEIERSEAGGDSGFVELERPVTFSYELDNRPSHRNYPLRVTQSKLGWKYSRLAHTLFGVIAKPLSIQRRLGPTELNQGIFKLSVNDFELMNPSKRTFPIYFAETRTGVCAQFSAQWTLSKWGRGEFMRAARLAYNSGKTHYRAVEASDRSGTLSFEFFSV